MKVPDLFVAKRLFCGVGNPVALGQGPTEIRGSGFIEGPLIVGNELKFGGGSDNATLMLSNCTNIDAATSPPLSILRIRSSILPTPTDVVIGDPSGAVGVSVYCRPQPFTVIAEAVNFTSSFYNLQSVTRSETSSSSKDTSAKTFTGAKVECGKDHNITTALNSAPTLSKSVSYAADFATNKTTLNSTFNIATAALSKAFDIPHPTKEGWRLRHICLEGPASEVYIRGKLKDGNKIELPDYWKGLVDPESITVSLTPIGTYQELYYEMGPWCSSVTVMNSAGGPVNCSYLIHAERVDVEKLIPEYNGSTPQDYPGDNSQYVINGGINSQTS